jgi:acyl-coenzyme A synthetase/AMP-(fatty) acid ligase/thioesterase domain-containing protein/acyl carrier protein
MPKGGSLSFLQAEIEGSIPERFARVAAACPDHLAVKSLKHSLTYHELDLAARQVALSLRSHLGDGPQNVSLLLENDAPMVVSILGVVMSGKYYCALNPDDPLARSRAILTDGQASLILTDATHLRQAQQISGDYCGTVCLEELEADGSSLNAPMPPLTPRSLMGIYYTSGSTGEPKAVPRNHGVILHRAWLDAQDIGLASDDRLIMLRPFMFAGSSSDVFGTLLTGAALHLFDVQSAGLSTLSEYLVQERITVLRPPIELLRCFLDSLGDDHLFPAVRCLILSGDVLYKKDVDQIRQHFAPDMEIIHHLATSETGVLARSVIKANTHIEDAIVPVGYPVPGKEILIVDESGKKLGPEQNGEIAVRTRWMAIDDQPKAEGVASRFIPDPDFPSQKVYLTGDMGRMRKDHMLEFVGRKDFQVKIRGFRVNTPAVVSTLMKLDGIRRAVVIARTDASGAKRLVAYLIKVPGSKVSPEDLRTHLAGELPGYMIPSSFVFVNQISITPSGKIDYRALPDPDWSRPEVQVEFKPARDVVERKMAGLWQEVLGIERVGIQDDFFALGGDSLSGASLCVAIEKEFGKRLYPGVLVENNTVERLALLVKQPRRRSKVTVPIRTAGDRAPLFLAPGNEGDTLYFRTLAEYLGTDQPVYGLQVAELGWAGLHRADFEAMAAACLQEIRHIQASGPYFLAGHSFGGRLAFAIAQRLVQSGDEVRLLVLLDTYAPGQHPQATISERIRLHLHNLSSLSAREWPVYFRQRVNNLIVRLSEVPGLRSIAGRFQFTPSDIASMNRIAARGYIYRRYPGKLVLFRVRERPAYVHADPTAGWNEYAEKVEVHDVPGDHANLLSEPNVRFLAEELKKCIQEADPMRPPEAIG